MAQMNQTGQREYKLYVTGHSLGAAVAMLAGSSLRKQGMAPSVYLYGCPKVGNAKFADFIASQPGITARITNKADLVTAFPFRGVPLVGDYNHPFPEYWFERGLAAPTLYQDKPRVCGSAKECTSSDCDKAGLLLGCFIKNHGSYAGDLSYKPCGGEPVQGSVLLSQLPGPS